MIYKSYHSLNDGKGRGVGWYQLKRGGTGTCEVARADVTSGDIRRNGIFFRVVGRRG